MSEPQFAALIDALAADPSRRAELIDLLREDHRVYDQRGAATVVRMRGWILIALARIGPPDDSLIFVLEELDTGRDPYLVAAAARALRAYPSPRPAFAPFLMRAFDNIRYHDERVSFDAYGEYATSATASTPVGEVLATLAWLGPRARSVLPRLKELCSTRGISKRLRTDLERTAAAIGSSAPAEAPDDCCSVRGGFGEVFSWIPALRRRADPVEAVRFEDQSGASVTFGEFFRGRPSIAAFFYTRCDNPLKCSLTVSKLARVQRMLAEQGLAAQIRTAAITYDPAYDLPGCLHGYGASRGVRMDADHRLLRAPDGMDALRRHFTLGVNFIGSLINRHRIEIYVLDADGRIAATFGRLHWNEHDLVMQAAALLREAPAAYPQAGPGEVAPEAARAATRDPAPPPHAGAEMGATTTTARRATSPALGTLASAGVAFLPKCPVCWAAYLSVFGIAGLERIPYAPWLQPLLLAVMGLNLASLWWRSRSTGRVLGFYLAAAGAAAIVAVQASLADPALSTWGVVLTLAGSVASVWDLRKVRPAPVMPLPTRV